jgi:ABC-type amino acid transport substrate-binding protein
MPEEKEYQITLSPQLLLFLQWLTVTEPKLFTEFLHKAYNHQQFKKFSSDTNSLTSYSDTQLSTVVFDFLTILEDIIQEQNEDTTTTKFVTSQRLPALKHLDIQLKDNQALAESITRAADALEKQGKDGAQETLYKEFIKRWKPERDEIQ